MTRHPRPRPALPLALAAALLPAFAAAPAGADDAPTTAEAPIISPADQRDYRALTLDNGLTVLLVSDPEADKAAASLNVDVGSAQDPDDLAGLAHYLEHMLFLGTEAYPQADAYQRFLSQHGGQHNAYTASQDTNYFFAVDPDALDGTLDRFSHFFVDPLFNDDRLASERQVVHSEYQARKRNPGRRQAAVLDRLLNPEHPSTRFSVGSNATLADRPEGETPLRQRVIAFYRQHYGAHVMHLSVVAPQPLDELETLVRDDFASVPDRGLSRPEIDAPLATPKQTPAAAELHSLRDDQRLTFYFPIPDPETAYRLKPAGYLANLLGHEGEGSLLDALRKAGWADGLSAGTARGDGHQALFSVDISLTPEGAKHRDRIQASLFAAIDAIRDHGVEAWRYDEQARLAEQEFRFQEHGSALGTAMRLATSLARYPLEDVAYGPYRMDGFDADRIDDWLDALRPSNMLRLYSGPEVEGDEQTPWFDVAWSPVSPEAGDAEPLSGLALPEPNPYIAQDLTLLDGQDEAPLRRIDTPAFDFWQMRDASFGTPRVEWRFSLQHPGASQDPREAALSRLLAGWLQDSLNEALYPARLAGQGFEAYAHARGITLSFSGWRDGQQALIERVLEQLESGTIEAADVARVRQQLRQQWRNAPQDDLYRQAGRTLAETLIRPQWSPETLLAASEALDAEALRDFRDDFLADLHLEAMAVGNQDAESATRQARAVAEALSPRLTASDIPELTTLQADGDLPTLTPDTARDEYLVMRYLQGPDRSLASQARLAVLGRLLETPFYQQLRTEQQLGYVVNAGYQPLLDAPGLSLLVQSPSTDSDTIQERIDAFLSDFGDRLGELDDEALAPYRQAVHDDLLTRDPSLSARTNRLWQALAMNDGDFTRRQRLAERALTVTPEALRTLWPSLVDGDTVQITHDPGDDASNVMALKADLPPLPDGSD
ncbi:insulinase family protein [Halomonas getboli]|uniref:insulinase family protein n=1 Tax=Halomonas getboli TaxID=2935862 RepID=UPI0020000D9D|nr:insulinase family protein [Halomonas getboli]MCK2185382.1 insulinase family protein [Halomonas getboli]